MKYFGWSGWILSGILFLNSVAAASAAPDARDPLEGRLLQDGEGAFYLYHGGLKFPVELASLGDQLVRAIPTGTPSQWDSAPQVGPAGAGGGPAGHIEPVLPGEPEPFPAYS